LFLFGCYLALLSAYNNGALSGRLMFSWPPDDVCYCMMSVFCVFCSAVCLLAGLCVSFVCTSDT